MKFRFRERYTLANMYFAGERVSARQLAVARDARSNVARYENSRVKFEPRDI